ncbi:hypothetical protein [Spirosoma agri]|uniref:Uncharacterized protein n=1 Tax=Spirosoma agri TaxID=1987381 RepID=A0A6M0IRC8_9BACT|nr:hypothetical protein [Spirosoma agri]NEU70840.1 hypothetical protein [Spirosoma agri]
MLLVFVTMDNEGHCRPFSCHVLQLEGAFDVLSGIITAGESLVSVELLDLSTGQRTSLPSEAFDGEPIRAHIEQLEESWQTLLTVSVDSELTQKQLLTAYSVRLYETYQTRIRCLERAVRKTDAHRQRVSLTPLWESSCIRLDMQLAQYRNQLERAQAGKRRVCKRLAPYLYCQ